MIYDHSEAFAMMRYRADDRSETHLIWNSRDGVTPFVVSLPSGKSATHVDWRDAPVMPEHKPKVGDLIFVDLTEELLLASAQRNAQRWWADPSMANMTVNRFPDVDHLTTYLADIYRDELERGAPALVQVTEDLARERGWLDGPPGGSS